MASLLSVPVDEEEEKDTTTRTGGDAQEESGLGTVSGLTGQFDGTGGAAVIPDDDDVDDDDAQPVEDLRRELVRVAMERFLAGQDAEWVRPHAKPGT